MPGTNENFYRIQKLPPYVFAVINEMKAKARAAQMDVVDLGMGNPDGATPQIVVDKLIEAARNPRNHRYSVSNGLFNLRREVSLRYARLRRSIQATFGTQIRMTPLPGVLTDALRLVDDRAR